MASPHATYREVCTEYVNYLSINFGQKCIVVFDGYDNVAHSTKSHEQMIRTAKITFPKFGLSWK